MFGLEVVVAFLVLVLGPIVYFGEKKQKQRFKVLIQFMNAKKAGLFAPIEFVRNEIVFRLVRIASGGGYSGVGGSFPTLWCYTKATKKLIIGNANSGRYTNGKFLILPPHKIAIIGSSQFLIGSESMSDVEEICAKLNSNPGLIQKLTVLFQKEFAHLEIATEIHLNARSLFARHYVFRFTGLSEEIYEKPELLVERIEIINELMLAIGVEFESVL